MHYIIKFDSIILTPLITRMQNLFKWARLKKEYFIKKMIKLWDE
jgi:hypothetical protein